MKILGLNSPLIFLISIIILSILGPRRIEKGWILFKNLLKFLLSNEDKLIIKNSKLDESENKLEQPYKSKIHVEKPAKKIVNDDKNESKMHVEKLVKEEINETKVEEEKPAKKIFKEEINETKVEEEKPVKKIVKEEKNESKVDEKKPAKKIEKEAQNEIYLKKEIKTIETIREKPNNRVEEDNVDAKIKPKKEKRTIKKDGP